MSKVINMRVWTERRRWLLLSVAAACVLMHVKYSNITLTFGSPGATHFASQAIHGVVGTAPPKRAGRVSAFPRRF
jgi:hypothetical protein